MGCVCWPSGLNAAASSGRRLPAARYCYRRHSCQCCSKASTGGAPSAPGNHHRPCKRRRRRVNSAHAQAARDWAQFVSIVARRFIDGLMPAHHSSVELCTCLRHRLNCPVQCLSTFRWQFYVCRVPTHESRLQLDGVFVCVCKPLNFFTSFGNSHIFRRDLVNRKP